MRIDVLRSLGNKPRVHGNGFIQLDMASDGAFRLHVFHEEIPRQKVATPIHDHVFVLRSRVLTGTLIHEELAAVPSSFGTHRVYTARQEEGTQNTILMPDTELVRLDMQQRLILAEGSVYQFPAGKFHQTDHIGLTATMMEKIGAPKGYGRPRVLVPYGEEPDNDFHRDAFKEETLWEFIDMACTAINEKLERMVAA